VRIRLPLRSATVAAAIGALLAACLAACSGAGSSSSSAASASIPQLRVGLAYSISTLNEDKDINAPSIDVLSLETLMRFGPQGNAEPYLATSVSRPDPVTYVYHLRHGVAFWDGSELTADDVAYSLNYDRSAGSQLAFSFASVKSITASGKYSVVVTLTHPDASWQYTPAEATAPVFEKKFFLAHQGTFGQPGALLMGTGPWQVDSFDPTKGAELSANPHWWGGKVPVQRVSFTFFANATSEALAFRANEIDLAPDVTAPQSFAATSGAKLLNTTSCNIAFFGMNTQTPPWNDVHVRRAVAYALNRQNIIAAHGGYATPLYTLIPPQLLGTIASKAQISSLLGSLPLYPYSPAMAKQELAKSAYPHGFSATLLEVNNPANLNEDQVVAAELQAIGIRAQIKVLPAAPWDAVESGPAGKRATTETGAGCFNPDPSAYYDVLGSQNTKVGSWNVADYAPPEVDNLMAAGLAASEPAKRFPIYSQLLQKLQADVPYVGLYVSDASIALSSKFTEPGYTFWPSAGTSGYPDLFLGIKPAA
jgi:peptide/nickel transport system substrate-binding protein